MILGKKWFWRVMLVVYLAALAYVCFANQGSLPKFDEWPFKIPADKCVHFVMFLPWPILACLSVIAGPDRQSKTPDQVGGDKHDQVGGDKWVAVMLIITIIGLGLAGTTEWVQGLLPYRSKDIWDFIADSLGLLTGALLFAAFYPFLRKSRTR